MTDAYVFDTEALIAFLYDEPGHEIVADLLADVFETAAEGYLAEANASEVFYLVARFEGTDDDTPTDASLLAADRDLRALERRGLGHRAGGLAARWRTEGRWSYLARRRSRGCAGPRTGCNARRWSRR